MEMATRDLVALQALHRAALVRAVVARDWGVAIVLEAVVVEGAAHRFDMHARLFSRLPCADDFVAGLLGEDRAEG